MTSTTKPPPVFPQDGQLARFVHPSPVLEELKGGLKIVDPLADLEKLLRLKVQRLA